jgi:Holliday junction DNA helicase RuvB
LNDERIISASLKTEDLDHETNSIRPVTFIEYIGQDKVRNNLEIFIKAAVNRNEALDHVLLYGPPGLGKTTLANIIASELNVNIRTTSGPAIERPGDLAAILTNLEPKDVLFIDEIHRLNRTVEEVLYPAMEDFCIDIIIGKGPSARTLRLDLPKFTLVGATTRVGMLSSPFRDRFGVICRLDYYKEKELIEIINRSAAILNIEIKQEGAAEIARRARGTPRIANRLLRRIRDYAEIKANSIITGKVAEDALNLLEVDELGLDKIDRKIIQTIINKFNGGPVGLDTIAATISESADTVEDVYEPYLMQLGLLNRTPRGRMVTAEAYRYFEVPLPQGWESEIQGSLLIERKD